MAIKVYLPTDSLQLYVDKGATYPELATATHCRIYQEAGDKITILDHLFEPPLAIVGSTLYSDIQNEAGSAAGGTMAATVLYLAKIIG